MKKYNVAVIGVGAVGIEMLRCLKQRNFPIDKLSIFARSARDINVYSDAYSVEAISNEGFEGIDIALFAGTEGEKGASCRWSSVAIEKGAVVIDNGADFRLKEGVPLVVPEINKDKILSHKGIIANPNCTTIQAVVALGGIFKNFGLKQFVLTSFQAASGAGREAANSLLSETAELAEKNKGRDFDKWDKNIEGEPEFFNRQIAFNVIAQIGNFQEGGFTSEEWKVVKETHKIFSDTSIKISATCVRVPVFTGHGEAIYFTTRENVTIANLERALDESAGVKYLKNSLSVPIDSEGRDEVFISRLRKDPYNEDSFWLWCVCDNLRKGAALNAVQIAEHLLK